MYLHVGHRFGELAVLKPASSRTSISLTGSVFSTVTTTTTTTTTNTTNATATTTDTMPWSVNKQFI